MKDLIVTINANSRKPKLTKNFLGINGENLQGNIIIDFEDEFIDGICYLEVNDGNEKYFITMEKVETHYILPIKSSLLKTVGKLPCQIRISSAVNEDVSVFKSEVFEIPVLEAINAVETIPDQYPTFVYEITARVEDLEENKQDKITSSNKLSADFVDDTNTTNKLVTDYEKNTWNEKQDALVGSGTGQNIKIVNNIDIIGNGNIDTRELYQCTYGTTTYAEITSALGNEKIPYLTYSDRLYTYQFTRNDGAYFFGCYDVSNLKLYTVYVTTTSTWSLSNKTVENVNNKVTSFSSTPTDTNYPSEKLVYDQLELKQGTLSSTQLDAINSGINSTKVTQIGTNTSNISTINGKIPSGASSTNKLTTRDVVVGSVDLSINNSTYVVTLQCKDVDGNNLGSAKTIDLPLESVVVSGSYDSTNKKVILTLQDGSTIEFSVADLVSGLQTEITSSNKLASDLVDDAQSVNQFVTSSEKNAWSAKQDAIDNSHKLSADLVDDASTTNKFVTTSDKNTWNGKQDSLTTKLVGDGTINKVIGFDSNGQLVKETPSASAGVSSLGGATGAITLGTGLAINNNELRVVGSGTSCVDLLWTNPSPTSNFAGQTLSINLTGYSLFAVAYKIEKSWGSQAGVYMFSVGANSLIYWPNVGGGDVYTRRFNNENVTDIVVSDQVSMGSITDNGKIIPVQIYGII